MTLGGTGSRRRGRLAERTPIRVVCGLAVILCVLAATAPATRQAPVASPEVRALWVVRTTLARPESVAAMIEAARAGGFNTLLVQVRGRGDAYYRTRIEPRAAALAGAPSDFDPLDSIIRQARAAGLSVHAWVNVSLVADVSDRDPLPGHVVRRHPDWLMVPRELAAPLARLRPADPRYVARLAAWTRAQSATVEGLYVSPANRHASDHVVRVVDDLVSRYAVDGVHFDYLRYPNDHFDFQAATVRAFVDEVGRTMTRRARRDLERAVKADPAAAADRHPGEWRAFRRRGVTELMRRLATVVRQRRPGALISAAVAPDLATVREARAQDWGAWLSAGLIDVVCPMAYTTDESTFARQIGAGRELARGRLIWAGIGAYRLPGDQTVKHIELARSAGADGVILFSYDSLVAPERGAGYLTRIARDAFGR